MPRFGTAASPGLRHLRARGDQVSDEIGIGPRFPAQIRAGGVIRHDRNERIAHRHLLSRNGTFVVSRQEIASGVPRMLEFQGPIYRII